MQEQGNIATRGQEQGIEEPQMVSGGAEEGAKERTAGAAVAITEKTDGMLGVEEREKRHAA